MKVSIEEVTPMVAEMLLQKNTNNYRKLSQPTVPSTQTKCVKVNGIQPLV